MGSPAIAAFIAFWAFWALLVYGRMRGDLTWMRIVLFLVLWLAGRISLDYISWEPAAAMFPPYVAILDIALVLVIFKGDIRLT